MSLTSHPYRLTIRQWSAGVLSASPLMERGHPVRILFFSLFLLTANCMHVTIHAYSWCKINHVTFPNRPSFRNYDP